MIYSTVSRVGIQHDYRSSVVRKELMLYSEHIMLIGKNNFN